MASLIGKRLGQYQILEEIGRGGMAVAYKAYQASLGRYVAIKVLVPHLSQDREFIKRFRREAMAAGGLDHPNIIRIYDVGHKGNLEYLVMTYVDGPSLAAKLGREGALDVRTAFSIVQQVGAALDYAHAHGVIHRDVKPSNILLTADGRAILSDFGIAKPLADSWLTQTGTTVGTPAYMSPEQAQGETLDGRSDLYSLGIVLYEMLTGQVPFHADTPLAVLYKQVHQVPPAPSHLNRAISGGLDRVVLRALQKDPKRRYASAGEMVRDLAKLVGAGPGLAGPGLRPGVRTSEKATQRSLPRRTQAEARPQTRQQGRSTTILVPLMAVITSLAIIAGAWLGLDRMAGREPTTTAEVETPSPSPTQSPSPTLTQPPSPTLTQPPRPTLTQSPTLTPTQSPSPMPTQSPSPSPTLSPLPSPTLSPTPTKIDPRFRADQMTIGRGDCTTLRWDVDGVQAVYLGNRGVAGHGDETVCPSSTQTYTLVVVQRDDQRITWPLTITVEIQEMSFELVYRGCIPHNLTAVGQVKGQVFDKNGSIIPNAYVEISVNGQRGAVPAGRTNEQGWYEWNLRPGQVARFESLTVQARPVTFTRPGFEVTATSGCYQRVDFRQR